MSSIDRDLEDPSKTCIYIPPGTSDEVAPDVSPYPSYQWRDLPGGYELRMQMYKLSWMKCLGRVKSIVRSLHSSVAAKVVHEVTHAYTDILPGLPYPELPVVAISAEGGSSSLYSLIRQQFDQLPPVVSDANQRENAIPDEPPRPPVILNHLYPADCLTLTAMMKAIVTGFVDQDGILEASIKRKPTTSLASYDINLLAAWYSALGYIPSLVVFLHDFEQFDPVVIQDVLYICSLSIPHLPLVFVLALSSPPTSPAKPSYLHVAYPRDTLALLRVSVLSAPAEAAVVEEIINKTFFDPDFEPDVVLGPAVLDFITDFSSRHCASIDALITMLQLIHLKHFTDPITLLMHPESHATRSRLRNSDARPFLDVLQARLLNSPGSKLAKENPLDSDSEERLSADVLLDAVSDANKAFRKKARGIRVALGIMRIVKDVVLGGKADQGRQGTGDLEMLPAVLRGRLNRDVRYLGMAAKKLSAQKLHELLSALHAFFHNLESAVVRREEEHARVKIVSLMAQLPEPDEVGEPPSGPAERPPAVVQLAADFGEWLTDFLEEHFVRLDECALWDVWYTGGTPFPSELINPAPRPTAVAALLHPDDVVHAHAELLKALRPPSDRTPELEPDDDERELELWELPDTTILFRRFVEAGRMVNVYDWFESFKVVLEDQQRHLCRRARQREKEAQKSQDSSPIKARSRKGKGKRRAVEMDVDEEEDPEMYDDEEDEELDEDEMEQWSVEVQARFMRALHELDFAGFIKHTGRKADHVIRTIYDVPD